MTIYVDDMRRWAKVRQTTARWSHLVSDLLGDAGTAELLDFAERTDLKSAWLQNQGKPTEHFDVTESRRLLALKLGAVPIKYPRESGMLVRAKRRGAQFDLEAFRAGGPDAQH